MDRLLAIVQDVCKEVGVPPPLTVISNVDPRALTFLALARKELRELGRAKWWATLARFATFNTVVSQTGYATAADFDKLVPSSIYGTSTKYMRGAINSPQWADMQRYGSIYGIPGFRMLGTQISIVPAPTVVETYAYEYKTKNRALAADAVTYKTTFTADDDTPLLDDGLIRLGITWRYRYSKGLEYAEDFRAYGEAVEQYYAQELAHGDLILASTLPDGVNPITDGFVPQQGYGP